MKFSTLFLLMLSFFISEVRSEEIVSGSFTNPMFKRSLTFSTGQSMNASLLNILTLQKFDFKPYGMSSLSYGQVVNTDHETYSFEVEGHLVKHWEFLDAFELTGVLLIRWMSFPWDQYLKTSFAVGGGMSWVTRTPGYELNYQPASNPLLHHLAFEIEVVLPQLPNWRLMVRDHHRSGVWGLFNNVWGGSDYMCFGLRYRF